MASGRDRPMYQGAFRFYRIPDRPRFRLGSLGHTSIPLIVAVKQLVDQRDSLELRTTMNESLLEVHRKSHISLDTAVKIINKLILSEYLPKG